MAQLEDCLYKTEALVLVHSTKYQLLGVRGKKIKKFKVILGFTAIARPAWLYEAILNRKHSLYKSIPACLNSRVGNIQYLAWALQMTMLRKWRRL